ncbi:MAG: D-inositol-3-phosphate glycosyltransferase [Elusimicrobia bacterium]|nr:D-inositol-3-phosphate glycosyltransferase [Elusimicrobiota bacterium]
MKILHLLDERWDSGLTQYALQITQLLSQAGHDACLGVLSEKKPAQMARAMGLNVYSIDSLLSFRRLLHAKSWDIINAHTGRTHTWALALGPRDVPIVRTRGDARPLSSHPLARFLYSKTAAVIAASAHIARSYEETLGLGENIVQVVYPSVTVDLDPNPLPLNKIGILGRLDPVKGHAAFLEAAADVVKEVPQAQFLIAGKEANVTFDLLHNQIKELGIEKSVSYRGYQASARDFMRSCSLGVIASIGSEEISRACLEWMSVGRAVVGTLVGCLPELIEPNETGFLVSPGDGSAMGEAILKLLREPEKIERLGNNALALAESKYSPEIQLSKTLGVYGSIAHRAH